MDYKLVSKMIFQSFIQNGVQVINSTPMLKGLIIAYLLENSIVYNDTDVNNLVVEVMRFLTVEEVAPGQTEVPLENTDIKIDFTDKELKIIASVEKNIAMISKVIKNTFTELESILNSKAIKEFDSIPAYDKDIKEESLERYEDIAEKLDDLNDIKSLLFSFN